MDVFFDLAEHNKSPGLNVETTPVHAGNKVYTFNTASNNLPEVMAYSSGNIKQD